MKIRHLIIYLLLSFMVSSLTAQEQDYTFHTFSPDGGFYYDGVKSVKQDRDGFMWILMDYELFRFDGYEYKRYYTHFHEWQNAADWCFNSIAVDQHNRLFVATNDGLYLYNKISDSFDLLVDGRIDYVEVDGKDNIWIKKNSNFGIFDVDAKTINYPKYDGKVVSFFRNILVVETGESYLLSNYAKLFHYDSVKNEIVLWHTQKTEIEGLGYMQDSHIAKGKLWVLIQHKGLYKVDLASLKIEEHYDSSFFSKSLLRRLHIDKKGTVWIASIDGLFLLDQHTKAIKHYVHSKEDKNSLPNNSVWTISEDWQQNIWIGTYAGGLSYVNINENVPFKTYIPRAHQLNHSPVSAFAEDDNFLWIGTEGGGINRMNKETQAFDYLTASHLKNSIGHNNVKSLVIDAKKNLWIGTFSGGIDCYNTYTEYFTNFKQNPNDRENSLRTNSIRKIVEEENEGLWIAYQLKKTDISFLSYKDHSVTHYSLCETDDTQYIFDMLRDRDNNLWVLTRQQLLKMNVKTHKVEDVPLQGFSSLNAQSLTLDLSGNLWIGTIGKGLIQYNINSATLTQHTAILSHSVSSIYSICCDGESNLWLGTDNGLFRYNVISQNYARYDGNDGTQGAIYYPLSTYKGKNGKIYFGGTNGYTCIDSDVITTNQYEPHAFITDFIIDNQALKSLENYLTADLNIVLDYEQSNFGFRFSSDNYLMTDKNKFKYRLHGYDNNWITADATTRLASYSKVPAGKYTFEVLAANNDGVWSRTPTQITVIRKPAPWLSWPAYVFYTLVLIAIGYAIIHYYKEKKTLKLQLYLDGVEKNKRDEIHESQLRFFTNISHDFRTPLSLIIGTVDKLRNEGLKESSYRILNGNSQRLLNLVNELMDFRAVENGKMNLEVEKVNVNEFVSEISSSFDDYAKQHKMNFEIRLDDKLSTTRYMDKYVIEKVIMNLLNNAFKYTKDKGTVIIETHASHKDFTSTFEHNHVVENDKMTYDKYYSIVVRDTGIGITKESIASVFERFYKVKTVNFYSHLGTGIGLALVKSLSLLHKGFITIHSEREKGTEIEVCFPLDDTSYSIDEIKTHEVTDVHQLLEPTFGEHEEDNYQLPDEATEGMVKENKYTLLLAEDNEDLRALIRAHLAEQYQVIEAANGMEAAQILKRQAVDIILSDIMMPIKDGIVFCSEVKSNIETSHIPFIMLSAKTSVESKIEGADSGADIYFEKPLNFDLLKLSLNNIFKQRDSLREHYSKNYFAESSELAMNEKDNNFLKEFIAIIEQNLDKSELDVNSIASQLFMSRSKLYNKIKGITGKSIVEFILNYRLRKAARLIIEEDLTMREVMMHIGIESQPYFTNAFKKEFGKTPTQFASENKQQKNNEEIKS